MSEYLKKEIAEVIPPKPIRILQAIAAIEKSHLQLALSGAKLFAMYQKFAPPDGFPSEINEQWERFLSFSEDLEKQLLALLEIVAGEPVFINPPRPE